MKGFLAGAAFMMACIALAMAFGGTAIQPVKTPLEEERVHKPADMKECELRGTYAAEVMKARQSGVAAQELYAIAGDDFTRSMVLHAYRRPEFGSEAYQRREIASFSSHWFLMCVEQLP